MKIAMKIKFTEQGNTIDYKNNGKSTLESERQLTEATKIFIEAVRKSIAVRDK